MILKENMKVRFNLVEKSLILKICFKKMNILGYRRVMY